MAQVTATTSICANVFIVDTTKVERDQTCPRAPVERDQTCPRAPVERGQTCPRAPVETQTGDYKLWDGMLYETKLQGPDKTEEELFEISEI